MPFLYYKNQCWRKRNRKLLKKLKKHCGKNSHYGQYNVRYLRNFFYFRKYSSMYSAMKFYFYMKFNITLKTNSAISSSQLKNDFSLPSCCNFILFFHTYFSINELNKYKKKKQKNYIPSVSNFPAMIHSYKR